jgi:spermidine synthase
MRLAAGGSVGRRIGGLLAANTIGGILGSVSASFLLLDGLGLWRSIAVLGIGYGIASLLTQGSARARLLRAAALAATVVAVFASAANPNRLPVVKLGENDRLVDASEGAYGIVAVLDGPRSRRMTHNNHYTLSGAGPLSVGRERLGHLPLLLHPEPRSAAFVGSATGITAGASVLHPLDEIVLVEIVPEVQRFAAEHFAESNRGVHRDPRTRLVLEDGRNHLRATRDRYDVIVADLFVPWRAGAGSLYSREHFEAVKARLSSDGVFCQWLPIYQFGPREFAIVAATFLDVFPNATVWRGDFFSHLLPRVALVGFAESTPTVPEVESRIQQIAGVGVVDRWIANPDGFWMLYVGPLARAVDDLAGVERNRDDRPVFEFRAARSTMPQRRVFVRNKWPAFSSELRRAESADTAPFGERGIEGARAGALLARINRHVLDGRPSEARAGMIALRESIPPELLSPPDPTVAEMWMPRQRANQAR